MKSTHCTRDRHWLSQTLHALKHEGFAIVEGALSEELLKTTRERMYRAQEKIVAEIGEARLRRAGEIGVLRLMAKYDSHFLKFLSLPSVLEIVDGTLSPTAILHLQNGFILPSQPKSRTEGTFQFRFHRDFPRYMSGYVASINLLFAIDEFRPDNGATLVVPGSHQSEEAPDEHYMKTVAVPAVCPAGSIVVFDSTLWHAAGENTSGADRLAINNQFTRSFIKQQIDYVRALGNTVVAEAPPRTQQLLGYYTRVVTSLDEYYQPEESRLYRKGQG